MRYSDQQRIRIIYETALKLSGYIGGRGITKEDLLGDYALQWLVTTPLYNIGEQVYYLSDEYKDAHPDIPWLMIAGLRHRLVHNYEGTNWNIIADVIFEELPVLTRQIKELIE